MSIYSGVACRAAGADQESMSTPVNRTVTFFFRARDHIRRSISPLPQPTSRTVTGRGSGDESCRASHDSTGRYPSVRRLTVSICLRDSSNSSKLPIPPSMISCSLLRWLKSRGTLGRLLEQHALDGQSGAESHAAAAPTPLPHNVLQHKHDGGGRHVAEVAQHGTGGFQGVLRNPGAFAHRVQDGAPARVNGPVTEFVDVVARKNIGETCWQSCRDSCGHFP